MEQEERIRNLTWDLQRSSEYHNMRAGHFRKWHRRAMLVVVFALISPALALEVLIADLLRYIHSTVPIAPDFLAALAENAPTIGVLIALSGVAAASADVLIDPGDQMARHRIAEGAYLNILVEMSVGELTEGRLEQFEANYLRVDSSFEERHVVVNLVATNRVLRASGYPEQQLSFWRLWLMHIKAFSHYTPSN